VVNTFGGQWFNTSWDAQLTSPAFEQATNFYVNLVKNYGEKGAGNDSFNQCLNIMQQQKAAMWYDATVAASTLDAAGSPVQARSALPGACGQDEFVRMAVELGAGRRGRVQEQVAGLDVHGLGHLQGLHRL